MSTDDPVLDAIATLGQIRDMANHRVAALRADPRIDDEWVKLGLEAEGETDPGYLAHSFAMRYGLREHLTHAQAVVLETALAEFLWAAR